LQYEKIDILIDVNSNIRIIIEDKTFTNAKNNPLDTYRASASKDGRDLICIYLKTGSVSKHESEAVSSKLKEYDFNSINRDDLRAFFGKHLDIKNIIYMDFVSHLDELENSEHRFGEIKIGEWEAADWIGFYRKLEDIFLNQLDKDCGWHRNTARQGGILFSWCERTWEGHVVYLEIDSNTGKLYFKIKTSYDIEIWNRWQQKLITKVQEEHRDNIKKSPKRTKAGEYMSVASIEREHWLGDENSKLNEDFVLKNLEAYEKFLIDLTPG
jgi:hypothetical protein